MGPKLVENTFSAGYSSTFFGQSNDMYLPPRPSTSWRLSSFFLVIFWLPPLVSRYIDSEGQNHQGWMVQGTPCEIAAGCNCGFFVSLPRNHLWELSHPTRQRRWLGGPWNSLRRFVHAVDSKKSDSLEAAVDGSSILYKQKIQMFQRARAATKERAWQKSMKFSIWACEFVNAIWFSFVKCKQFSSLCVTTSM